MLSQLIFILASRRSRTSPLSSFHFKNEHITPMNIVCRTLSLPGCGHSFLRPSYTSLLLQIRLKCCSSEMSLLLSIPHSHSAGQDSSTVFFYVVYLLGLPFHPSPCTPPSSAIPFILITWPTYLKLGCCIL